MRSMIHRFFSFFKYPLRKCSRRILWFGRIVLILLLCSGFLLSLLASRHIILISNGVVSYMQFRFSVPCFILCCLLVLSAGFLWWLLYHLFAVWFFHRKNN